MVNKTDVRNAINKWLKTVKLNKGEDFAVFQNDDRIKVEVCNEEGVYRDDYKEKKTLSSPNGLEPE